MISTKNSYPLLLAGWLLVSANGSFAFQSAPLTTNQRGRHTYAISPKPAFVLPGPRVPALNSRSRLHLFFGNDQEALTKNKELAFFPKLATSNTDVKFESLTGFISTWSQKFEDDRKGMGLTTPVKITPTLEDREEEPDANIVEQAGVRIIFQPTKTGYKSKTEEDASKEGGDGGGEAPKKKKGPPKEGGVEIRVEKMTNGEIQLRASRCDTDEDTMVKEMSEEAIVSQLKQAVDAWKKQ